MSQIRNAEKIMVRLPVGMRDRLKAEAEANCRSVNAEVVVLLKRHLGKTETAEHSAKSASAA